VLHLSLALGGYQAHSPLMRWWTRNLLKACWRTICDEQLPAATPPSNCTSASTSPGQARLDWAGDEKNNGLGNGDGEDASFIYTWKFLSYVPCGRKRWNTLNYLSKWAHDLLKKEVT
jgi:hypothetical protein